MLEYRGKNVGNERIVGGEEDLLELKDSFTTGFAEGTFGGTEKNRQVMMRWEKSYMEACVDALSIGSGDDVLEIGFGMGYSACRIQSKRPKSHTIIECDKVVLSELRNWIVRSNAKGVRVVEGRWEHRLGKRSLGKFDCVFFDDFPLPVDEKSMTEKEIDHLRRLHEATKQLGSRWHVFVTQCLRHMKAGARVSGYMAESIPWGRKDVTFVASKFPVKVPKHCQYASGKTYMYVPRFERTDGRSESGVRVGLGTTRDRETDDDAARAESAKWDRKRPRKPEKTKGNGRFHRLVLAQLGIRGFE